MRRQVSVLKIKVKNGKALRYIDSQLQKTADRLSVSRDELEEISIPAYGMEEIGCRVEQFGDFTAQSTVEGNRVNLVWLNAMEKSRSLFRHPSPQNMPMNSKNSSGH